MIVVLVAEDELPLLRNLSNNIEKLNGAFHVAARAADGQEAIEALKNHKISLAFLDINMPVLDGMEVLKYIQDQKLQVVTVIVSGYREFAYAQQAICYGVKEYLLKPLNKEKLADLLDKLEDEFQARDYKRMQELHEHLLLGEDSAKSGLGLDGEKYYIGAFWAGTYQMTDEGYFMTVRQKERVKRIRELLGREFPAESYWLINGRYQAEWILLVKETVTGVSRRIRTLIQQLDQEEGVPVTAILGETPVAMGQIHRAYEELGRLAKKNMRISASGFFPMHIGERREDFEALQSRPRDSGFVAVYNSIEGISRALRHELELTGDIRSVLVDNIKRFFQNICGRANCECAYADLEEDILKVMEQGYDLQEIEEGLQEVILYCFRFNVSEGGNKKALAWEMKKYLEEQFATQITSAVLQERFGFVPIYLRSIFREHYECTPNEYLQRLRLKKAKELLSAVPEISLKKIAEEIGYQDSMYFSKIFKKQEGMAPSEYRKRVSNNP